VSAVSRIRGRTRPVIGLLSSLVVGCLLAACTQGGSNGPDISTTTPTVATSSPTPSPTATAPVLPDAAKVGTRAGAEAFFRHFWDVYNYSYARLDTAPLRAITEPTCQFCQDSLKDLADAIASRRHFVGGQIQLGVLVAAPIDAGGKTVINSVASQTEGRLLGSDGSTIRTFPVQRNARVDTAVRWENSRWTVVEVSIRSATSSS
jgi:hypothetical protein